jgi:Secretion system C-terminal sorting domain
MKKTFKILFFAGLSLLCIGLQSIHSQSVTLSISGSNPRCQSAFPNGAPYSGTAFAPASAAVIVSATFQLQRFIGGTSWSFWGGPFTVNGAGIGTGVAYTNNSAGATQLTLTPVETVRMRATIRYRNSTNGPIITTTAFSPSVSYNWFPSPTANFLVNNNPAPPFPGLINHYTCTGDLFLQPNGQTSGTGVQWRLLLFSSSSTGTTGTPFPINDCGWRTGFPPTSVNVTSPETMPEYSSNCSLLPRIYTAGEYIRARFEVRNDCGISSKDVLLRIFSTPNSATVNFFFRGSNNVDALESWPNSNTGTGEQNPTTGTVAPNDGVLSWGGTETQPTLVGASQTVLDCSGLGFLQGIQSWNVKIFCKFNNVFQEVGSYDEIPSNNQINIQSVPISFPGSGLPFTAGYFSTNFNTSSTGVLGKEFKVELTGTGVCVQEAPKKVGYFKIASGASWWLPVDGNDLNGETALPDVSNSESFTAMPNPTTGQLMLEIEASQAAEATIRVVNLQGQTIQLGSNTTIPLVKGYNSYNHDISPLPSGTYYIQLVKPDNVLTTKVVKL